ncbi:hypothetical protein OOU_Y34scaffold00669g21 [Pyricularia oryzae Y34]|uniref:Uncharacterized protein n=2 Tax=Pyricularia oryzae TaxID=318829 RepID=A0AA97NTE8_PYRO3|nr:hypothetical protein OOU_Y34scaffold00669g21 [Pyricularia oryzae Y34]
MSLSLLYCFQPPFCFFDDDGEQPAWHATWFLRYSVPDWLTVNRSK